MKRWRLPHRYLVLRSSESMRAEAGAADAQPEALGDRSMQIRVTSPTGEQRVSVTPQCTVQELKQILSQNADLPSTGQLFRLGGGAELPGHASLQTCC
eukprot:SAG11_NODE_6440_length_1313_cov_1.361614_2_plen_97_part_01